MPPFFFCSAAPRRLRFLAPLARCCCLRTSADALTKNVFEGGEHWSLHLEGYAFLMQTQSDSDRSHLGQM